MPIARGERLAFNLGIKFLVAKEVDDPPKSASLKNEELKSRCKKVCIINFQPDLLQFFFNVLSSLALKYNQYCLVN